MIYCKDSVTLVGPLALLLAQTHYSIQPLPNGDVHITNPKNSYTNWIFLHTWLIVLFGPMQKVLLSSRQSTKPQSAGQGGFAEFELGYQNRNAMFKPPQLKSDWLWRLANASTTFRKPSQRFPQVLGISLKSLESSLRKPKCSLSFLFGPWILTTVLYKYEALPLQNIITFTLSYSLDLRPNLILST